jgi:hypothetical protein
MDSQVKVVDLVSNQLLLVKVEWKNQLRKGDLLGMLVYKKICFYRMGFFLR